MSTLVGFGVDEGAGVLGLDVGGSGLDIFGADGVVEESDRAGEEGPKFVCGVTELGAGRFWKSVRMSTLVGFGVGVDGSDLYIKGATGLIAVGEIIMGV